MYNYRHMRKIFRIIKHLIFATVAVLVALYTVLYVTISIPRVQHNLRAVAVEIVSELLNVPLSIERIEITPFNRVELYGVTIPDQQGDTLLYAKKIGAGINYWQLILEEQISLNNIQLFGANVHITRQTPTSPTNLQFIIDAFASEEPPKQQAINLHINSTMLRRCKVRYDVLSEPRKAHNEFDTNHIAVEDLTTTLHLRALQKDSVNVHIKRFSCKENSGLFVERLSMQVIGNREEVSLSDFNLRLPHSHITSHVATIDLHSMQNWEQWADSAQLSFAIKKSHIVLSDIAPIVPALRQFDTPISLSCNIDGSPNALNANQIELQMSNGAVRLGTTATVKHLFDTAPIEFNCNPLSIKLNENGALLLSENLGVDDPSLLSTIQNIGKSSLNGRAKGTTSAIEAHASLFTQIGDLQVDLTLQADTALSQLKWEGSAASDGLDLAQILGQQSRLGLFAFNTKVKGEMRNKRLRQAMIDGTIDCIEYNQYPYNDIVINGQFKNNRYSGIVQMNDANGQIAIDGIVQLEGKNALADVVITGRDIDLEALKLASATNGKKLSFNIDANYTGNQLDNANGYVYVNDVFYGNEKEAFTLNELKIEAHNDSLPQYITIASDVLVGEITGEYTLSALGHTFTQLARPILPTVAQNDEATLTKDETEMPANNFKWSLAMYPNIKMSQILNLPFTLTDTATINGYIDDNLHTAALNVRAPNIWFGLTHLEALQVDLESENEQIDLRASTNILDAKQHPTRWETHIQGKEQNIDLSLAWDALSQPAYKGYVHLQSQLVTNAENSKKIDAFIDVLPSEIVINDTAWVVKPAHITLQDKYIDVENVELARPSQHIIIDGTLSTNSLDTLCVDLQDVNLNYIFETLNIDFVTFGGSATGRVDVANVFAPKPHIVLENLQVENFSYNGAVFGNLSAYSHLDTDNMGILIKGAITNAQQQESYVDGYIFPTRDSISIAFDVDHVPLKFLHPFVQTIFTEVDGSASGSVVLEGNFERICVYGDAFAHRFTFGVPFINTRYTLSDSIHLTRTQIRFDNVTAMDDYGNTAKASGVINHKYFINPEYDIKIYDARNIMAFDVRHTPSIPYFGTIYGWGDVSIKGNEAYTNIDVNMTAGAGSTFTFALTNSTNAVDYPFLSFTNKEEENKKLQKEKERSEIESFVIQNNMLMEKKKLPPPITNILSVNIVGNITPESEITILMNEITGDKLRGNGDGTLQLNFNTADNAILMQGTVSIDKGFYDFSWEDIITRNFNIQQGSTVTFKGDPLDAVLDIDATYSLQADLADLDQSFSNDSELGRTTVPVDAVLHIDGNMLTPDITFDINLPTLSADMESRMRSIVGTDEMMTRQVIYLLVLNRFFTPEYSSQTSYNQWGAMAASTLSSSIGALMGQLSQNWSIAPKLHSDRGDFSDLEVDLLLSSQLLNNRLIFNGNFGYRDSRYSSTNFIGDFDIEYLLTENGNLRLKGYNHFNDRNYSMRTALTTQGIGLIYKHDFNSWSNFFEFSKPIRLFEKDDEDEYEYVLEEYYEEEEVSIEQSTDSIVTINPDILE